MIVAIEYTDKNELLIRTDSEISLIEDNTELNILTYNYEDTIFSSIENARNAVIIKKEEN